MFYLASVVDGISKTMVHSSEDFNLVSRQYESQDLNVQKMEETFETESLPVLKKGSYNLDFLDDNACFNPFESKCKLSQSPPINSDWNENVNPFQTKSKLGQSPPISSDDNFNSFDNDSSKTRLSPLPFNKANDNEKNGNQTEDDMNNLSFDQKRYIEDQSLDQFADSRFNYEDENLELTNKNISHGSDCNEERVSRLSMSDREQSFDSLEENSTPDRSIGHDIGFSLVEDHSPTDNVYDDFKDAENQDECISESNTFESELSEHGRQLNTDTTENAESLDLKTHSDELKELNSTEVEENARKEIEHQVNDVIDNLNCLESNPEKPFCFSDIAEPQNNEMFPVGQSTVIQQTEKNHPDLINDVSNSEVPSVCFEDGKSQENLELTEGETLIEKEVKEEFSHFDAMDNETQKTDPCDDLSSSIVLSSPNLCEDSGLGDSIVTSGSEDLDKVEDIKSEEGMDSPPVTPVSSNQDLTVSQKNDVGFEDEEYFQTNEALPEMPQALSADNGEELFSVNTSENACTALENREQTYEQNNLEYPSLVGSGSECSIDDSESEFLNDLASRELHGEISEGKRENWEDWFSEEEIQEDLDSCQSVFEKKDVFGQDLSSKIFAEHEASYAQDEQDSPVLDFSKSDNKQISGLTELNRASEISGQDLASEILAEHEASYVQNEQESLVLDFSKSDNLMNNQISDLTELNRASEISGQDLASEILAEHEASYVQNEQESPVLDFSKSDNLMNNLKQISGLTELSKASEISGQNLASEILAEHEASYVQNEPESLVLDFSKSDNLMNNLKQISGLTELSKASEISGQNLASEILAEHEASYVQNEQESPVLDFSKSDNLMNNLKQISGLTELSKASEISGQNLASEILAEHEAIYVQNEQESPVLDFSKSDNLMNNLKQISGLTELSRASEISPSGQYNISIEGENDKKNYYFDNKIKPNSIIDENAFFPRVENLLGLSVENSSREAIYEDDVETDEPPMSTITQEFTDRKDFSKMGINAHLSSAYKWENESLADSNMLASDEYFQNAGTEFNSESGSGFQKNLEYLATLGSEKHLENIEEEFLQTFNQMLSSNEQNCVKHKGENIRDDFDAHEMLNIVSNHEDLSENKIQDCPMIFNPDTKTIDSTNPVMDSEIPKDAQNEKINSKIKENFVENIFCDDLSFDKSVRSKDNSFSKDLNPKPLNNGSVESSEKSVFGALVIGSQLIASAILGPSAVCPPALKNPYFNFPSLENKLPEPNLQHPLGNHPQPPAAPVNSTVPICNEQISSISQSNHNDSVLPLMVSKSEESYDQPFSDDFALGLQNKESSSVEKDPVQFQSNGCAAALLMSDSARSQVLEDDVSSFTDCFSTPDEALITGSPSDPHSIDNDNFQEISNKDSSSLETGEESSISSGSVNLAEIPNPDELIEKTPPTTKPSKKKLKGKVLKKKNMQPKITNIIDRKDLDDDDIKDLIAGKKMSLATEISSNINEDASSSVDMIQVPPNKNSPSNAKPVSKSKSSKRTLPKISKNSDPESPSPPHMPTINGHHQMVVSEHSLDGGFSPTPVKCIPRLEKSLSSDSYPEMAPDFGVEDGDAQDIANEGCVPVSEVFNESTTWEMLEKFGDEGSFKDSERDQAPQSVYMKLEPGVGCSATSTGGHFLHSKGNQPITNGDKTARAIHEGNEYMQMTSSEPPSKTPSSKTHRHPAARVLDGKAGGGSTAMKKREIDNHDNVSVSQKEEKFDKDEKESDELEYQDAHDDFPLTLGDSWVEQVHNFTEIEDSSLGLSQDSLEGLSWSHTDNGLASDTPIPYGCCLNKSSLQTVDYDPDSDSGVAVDTSSPAHHATNGTESIVQLVPDPAQQTTSSSDPSQVLKYSQSEWNKMKQEQELEFQTRLLQKEKDWSKKLAEKERRLTDQEKRIMLLDDQTRNLKQSNEDMRLIVAEFEKTIAQLQAEKEKTTSASQESLENVLRERDQALEDLQSVETAFSDLHRRYEKTKNVVEGFKKNEDILKKCVQDYQLKIKRAEQKLLAIRQQAEEKLEQANTEIEKLRRSTSAEIAKLEAALKKSDIQVQALERTVDQKTLENQELTAICDELIAKVGDVS